MLFEQRLSFFQYDALLFIEFKRESITNACIEELTREWQSRSKGTKAIILNFSSLNNASIQLLKKLAEFLSDKAHHVAFVIGKKASHFQFKIIKELVNGKVEKVEAFDTVDDAANWLYTEKVATVPLPNLLVNFKKSNFTINPN